MQNWITDIMEQFGYAGIALVIALENLFPPIPSEVILTFGGFMTTKTQLTVPGVILASTIGSVAGAVVLYLIGLLLEVRRLERIVERWGHVLRVKKEDIHRADRWFAKYGYWTVFFCRMIPLVRSLISIPAGMARMKFGLFLLFTTIGTLIWNTVLVYLGAALGESWESIVHYMDMYSHFTYAVIGLVALAVLYLYLRRARKMKAQQ
ncbi:MAG TPA: DedA family protein [Paenibacillus cookii]|uniref:Alkaline phosphatase n=1 Tax=Paenibacillus cookii TaxID=157839 RepID=A0ABQ4LV89_9BACL|nr:DedA family protein [Paenibacillus cookii]GIO66661.1 alkaline phosphatase [Paenibacillus cookii]HWO53925.1 DedA family protein [Paenibacillus cookii]